MKKLLYVSSLIFVAIISIGQVVGAQGTGTLVQLQQFVSTTSPVTGITQQSYGKSLILTGLTANSNLCLDSNNRVTTSGCTGGGGGGTDGNWSFFNNSGIKLATTTNSVLIGASATSTRSQLEVNAQAGITPFYVGSSTPYFVVGSTGNVGIGTNNPTQALYVNSTNSAGGIYSDGTNNPSFSLATNGTLRGLFGAVTSAGAYSTDASVNDVVYQTKGGKFLINTNGGAGASGLVVNGTNVGIGTTTPNAKLTINNGGVTTVSRALTIEGLLSAVDAGHSIDFFGGGSQGANAFARIAGVTDAGGSGGELSFYTASVLNGSASTERVRINRNGNVGIGTTTPNQLLHVNGQASFEGNINLLPLGTVGQSVGINFNQSRGSLSFDGALGGMNLNIGSRLFDVNAAGVSRLRVDASGNVGIGNASPNSKLNVQGNVSAQTFTATSTTATSTISTGGFAVGGSQFQIQQNSGRLLMGTDLGGLANFYTGNAGTVGAFQSNGLTNGAIVVSANGGNSVTGSVYGFKSSITTSDNAYITTQQNGAGNAVLEALVLGAGDAKSLYGINGGQTWAVGLDNSDSDNFKISGNANLETNTYLTINTSGNVGIGTTTPTYLLNPSSATAPQLSLSAGAGLNQWAFRNAGGTFYLASTTVAGTATTTTAAIEIQSQATTTLRNKNGFDFNGSGNGMRIIPGTSTTTLEFY